MSVFQLLRQAGVLAGVLLLHLDQLLVHRDRLSVHHELEARYFLGDFFFLEGPADLTHHRALINRRPHVLVDQVNLVQLGVELVVQQKAVLPGTLTVLVSQRTHVEHVVGGQERLGQGRVAPFGVFAHQLGLHGRRALGRLDLGCAADMQHIEPVIDLGDLCVVRRQCVLAVLLQLGQCRNYLPVWEGRLGLVIVVFARHPGRIDVALGIQVIGHIELATIQKELKMRIVLLHPDAIMPTKGSQLAAAMDLYMPEAGIANGIEQFHGLGIAAAIPKGYAGLILPRSGVGSQHGLELNNTCGVIDADYRGEWRAAIRTKDGSNFSWKAGDRILQCVIVSVWAGDLMQVDSLDETARGAGGFGSSGQ